MSKNDDGEVMIRRCYKCEDSIVCNVNIVYTASNSTVTLWNKFQIYVYEDLELGTVSKVLVPEFQIRDLITSSNYLICVDNTDNVHTTSLKFKNTPTQKRFKSSFQRRQSGVKTFTHFRDDQIVCLKYISNSYSFNIHGINAELHLEKSVNILCNEKLPLPTNCKYILKSSVVNATHLDSLVNIFNISLLHTKNYNLVVISFDKLNIYGCLLCAESTEEHVTLVKLYTCPSQICNIDIVDIGAMGIIIGLKTGTIVSLNLKENTTKTVHLNVAIHKFLIFEDNIMYTDGLTMWVAENLLSSDLNFNQMFVKNVNDFIKFGDHIICTTFNNSIYTFSLDDEKSYIKMQLIDEYCLAQKLLESPNNIDNVMGHVKDIEGLLKIQKLERDYIMALSISSRQDVMDEVIGHEVIVYDSYSDAITENNDTILTNKVSDYFNTDLFYFIMKLNILQDHKLGDVLTNSIGDLRLHFTMISGNKLLKTCTIKLVELLNSISFLMPLKAKFINLNEMRVETKLMTYIPGSYDAKQKIWTVLYRKSVILNSEHFIKFNFDQRVCLKNQRLSLAEQIAQTAMYQHGSIINLANIEQSSETRIWEMYVRLPIEYQYVLSNRERQNKCTSKKVHYFLQLFTSEDFLKSKSNIDLTICNDKVKIGVFNDGFTNPMLKISGHNMKVVFDMRNFLSNLIYGVFADFGPGKEYVNHSFYVTIENMEKSVKNYVRDASSEDIQQLIEQFERKVIGALLV